MWMAPDRTRLRASGIHGVVRGFTLIELLVVVAIIGLLVAILIPSLRAARERSKSAACLSNTRQLVTVCQMYAQEFNNTLPSSGSTVYEADANHLFLEEWCYGYYGSAPAEVFDPRFGTLAKYAPMNVKILSCPTSVDQGMVPIDGYGVTTPAPIVSYGVNKDVMGISVTKVTQPVDTVLFQDSATLASNGTIQGAIKFSPPLGIGGIPSFAARHGKQGNVSFVDGHAATMDAFISPSLSVYSPTYQSRIAQIPMGYLTRMPANSSLTQMQTVGSLVIGYYYFYDKDAGL